MNNDLLLKRIDELCTEKGVKKTTAFTESHVGKNFASNLKTSNPSQKNLALLAQSASIEGRMRIIQVCMNEKDSKGETIIAG